MSQPLKNTIGYQIVYNWLTSQQRKPFLFQQETWQHIINGKSGLVNAPTGCGKTYSVFLGALIQFINEHSKNYKDKKNSGLQLLWITPLRALAKDIARAMEEVIAGLEMKWKIGIRNGDTNTAERARQKKQMPEVLIITPESLHLLLAQKGYKEFFSSLKIIAVDEWHELLGSKRGVQVELAISRIVGSRKQDIANTSDSSNSKLLTPDSRLSTPDSQLSIWGISATIGNIEEAKNILISPLEKEGVTIKAEMEKTVEVESIFPDEIEKYPWSGHLGIKLISKVIPIVLESKTTLIFINTRGMSETWYQKILDACPELAGVIALHHGSVDMELRTWIEENLHSGKLKAVVCTASLDLGVDFRPVETVIQVGSPKGVARFLQRAGRSGHSFDAASKIYFLPTHSLELMEAAALKNAIAEKLIESREPMILCYDVLVQYLSTLAVSDGFDPECIFKEIITTNCYKEMTEEEWNRILNFISSGGNALQQYDDYKKMEWEDGLFKIKNRRIAMRHRMNIGTIVSESMLKVKFISGGYVGVIEEYFISRLQPGDVFTLAGRNLEFVAIKDMTALVKKSSSKKSKVPSWQGGRMPLSANLGFMLRKTLDKIKIQNPIAIGSKSGEAVPDIYKFLPAELVKLKPLFELQEELSYLPGENELLIEQIETEDGFHLFVYPFEGRLVHEAMAAILAYRISRITPITFSFAMNDYGFELLSDQPIPIDDSNVYELFSPENLLEDIQRSINSTEMAKRKFRDIAVIGGLIFQGYPGEQKKARHLQNSASLLFNVLSEYEPDNLLLRQSYTEVMEQQMEEARLRDMLKRIQDSKIVLTFPKQLTPFCFPVKVDSLREELSSEKLEDRIRKMIPQS
ncbi:MAG: ligase-associated DNA damage response DEXH box helicase [Bacteroidetes bacterium]|nr:ligase-associated DNA damage response DEXH box helicase [Bacteroidota bacterium]MBS1633921.1 ligase-associated DNA damage response DEXH box helicase [Bacteroidota bacterium]